MKPNFEKMSNKELTAYVLENREDMEALDTLVDRRTPDSEATIYPTMFTEDGVPIKRNIDIGKEAIAQRVEQVNQKQKNSQN
ncbi:hypothetical protein [Kamptonema sp. UHCC 0994]|uniref:DUF6887 family protein n=1 Tax=Kamptonema sp. UHCC 0994 TaxID=3031329 RepID=UPI0023BA3A63|nr:hypothetical protein [Kamptonema sp. UHCC 0994]MDF0554159.1 hypothetical protein [Kamptonema sp. UHCC 0994]